MALLIGACSPDTSAAGKDALPAYKPGISVQLWSVRDALKSDFEGTIRELAAMGFNGVEFAGDFGPFEGKPTELRNWLAGQGLTVSGAHVPAAELEGEAFEETVKFYKALGAPYLIIPMDSRAFTETQMKDFAALLTGLSEKLTKRGLQVGYHNHAQEWASYKDTTFMDYLASNTPFDVILQQDVGWTLAAGKQPLDLLKAYPCRTLTTHFKVPENPQGKQSPIIGKDSYNWKRMYTDAVELGGAAWIVLEQEQYPEGMTPLEAIRASKKGFDTAVGL